MKDQHGKQCHLKKLTLKANKQLGINGATVK